MNFLAILVYPPIPHKPEKQQMPYCIGHCTGQSRPRYSFLWAEWESDKYASAQSSCEELTPYSLWIRLLSQWLQVEFPKRKPLLPWRQPRSIYRLNMSSIFSTLDLTHFRSSDMGATQHARQNFRSMDLSHGSFSGRGRNSLYALIKLEHLLHLANFNVRKLNQVRQKASIATTIEFFK